MILFSIRNMLENIPNNTAQTTTLVGIRNFSADIRNVPTSVLCERSYHS